MASVDRKDLEAKVKKVYRMVAEKPRGKYHFEMGRRLAEKLGYPPSELDRIPEQAIDSFAGVGYHFDLAKIKEGENVLDLGSGSGTDAFFAALKTGRKGMVVGVDMTEEQLEKAEKLKRASNFENVSFKKGHIERLPLEGNSFDVVISNGVINLSAEKEKVFKEAGRALKKGGRLAISDIVTEKQLNQGITCDADLWASCIGGAMQIDEYRKAIQKAGFRIVAVRENRQYEFLSQSAREASVDFGVKSISLLAEKVK
ncbi:MAG: methyltransferase domain-containing protein [Candidatus Aenigmarchaeota archaeon]|nr:methyltransferase domain-containing protein [Candidatus Aenigmarchaeota archaeon]